MKIVVIGGGSIGCRHAKNLRTLGVSDVTIVEPDENRSKVVAADLGVEVSSDIQKSLASRPDAVFVCTPPILHAEHALMAVQAGAHVFVEKPVATDICAIDRLIDAAKAAKRTVQVGYNLRFIPGLQAIKKMVVSRSLGKLEWGRFEFGQYLPDWRPWQDYQKSYTANAKLGGGIVLDGSHEIDLALWIFGKASSVIGTAAHVSNLIMDVEDSASLTLAFDSGAYADVHVDCVQRRYSRELKLCFEKGVVKWSWPDNMVHVFEVEKGESVIAPPAGYSANDMYLEEARAFLAKIGGERDLSSLYEGREVVKVALATLQSSREFRSVSLEDVA